MNFITNESDILFYVVGNLSGQEERFAHFLSKLTRFELSHTLVIIIHNY